MTNRLPRSAPGSRVARLPKPGDRIRARKFALSAVDDNETVPPGTGGTVRAVDRTLVGGTQVWVAWDNGARIAVLHGIDEYEIEEES